MVEISVVVFQDGDLWVAQCVEYDIAARSDSIMKLPRAFDRSLAANLLVNAELGRKDLDGIDPAPPRFRTIFDESTMDLTPRKPPERAATRFRLAEAA